MPRMRRKVREIMEYIELNNGVKMPAEGLGDLPHEPRRGRDRVHRGA